MLTELRVAQLGLIEDVTIVLGPGMTVLTGETGAGKTLIVDAIGLLRGLRGDAAGVRPGATQAVVEGRFVAAAGDEELVLRRTIPAVGRGRAYLDGHMVSGSHLAEVGEQLVDLHGQHAHQSLLHPAAQRRALDAAAGLSSEEVAAARRAVRELMATRAEFGGDPRARARELDLVRFQLAELDAAGLVAPTEDADLRRQEESLSDAAALRQAAGSVADCLGVDDGVIDRLGSLVATLAGRAPLAALHDRLLSLQMELSDLGSEARSAAETFEEDPQRLAEIGARRQLLTELRRKYGATLDEVMEFREQTRTRVTELEAHDERARLLEADLRAAEAALGEAEARLGQARRAAAGGFASAIESVLRQLAMPRARFQVEVGPDRAGETVSWLLGANPGEPLLPLSKVASGGELARAMLAVRLLLTGQKQRAAGPATLVFDEVDAGIGGEAAVAVGHALASLSQEYQVLVVTHLPQIAALGDRHLVVRKQTTGPRTRATVEEVAAEARVTELSRLLSGRADSLTARRHAEELLAPRATSPRRAPPRPGRPSTGSETRAR